MDQRKGTSDYVPDFDAITMRLASPERIRDWSFGEVTKPETVNYRTQRSERKGLFDEAIFGPERDYECYCGKYRRIRYKDIVCEKCNVEVTRSIVRRERMGHIELATPVAHIWYLRSIPSKIGMVLGLSASDLEKVIYFSGYLITEVNESERKKVYQELDSEYKSKLKSLNSQEAKDKLKEKLTETKAELDSIVTWKVLDEVTYHRFSLKYGHIFEAEIGAEALFTVFRGLDLDKFFQETIDRMESAPATEKVKLRKRLELIKSFKKSGVRPEWMFMTVIPVIPPAIRPMVALDGGRHATSDINDLYRRVINRNNRLKKLMDINAPDVILRNEKRILQEAVDALIDNSIHKSTGAVSLAQRRPLKSLSDNLKGKSGRFRQNLLGKRVDYSGRSVIVVGPELKLHQCGLPKHMALELFRPFVIAKLLEREYAFNIRGAGKLIDEGTSEVWEILEEVIEGKRVLLNRAPTLHRLGIQAFEPVLIEGNAIQIHPLVCTAFNADFDGDQMAVHLPLGEEAQWEAREMMAAEKNILGPGNNEVITKVGSLDIILGIYWMTNILDEGKDEKDLVYFESANAAIGAYDYRQIGLRDEIMVMPGDKKKFEKFEGKPFRTSVGRLFFNYSLPSDFPYVNEAVIGKDMSKIVDGLIANYGLEDMPKILDKIKHYGFRYAKKSGISFGIDDVRVPEEKPAIIAEAREKIAEIEAQHDEGFISEDEKYRMSIEVWYEAQGKIGEVAPNALPKDGALMNMNFSGARGNKGQTGQMSGMKGLIQSPTGKIINFPVIPSYIEGLSPLEYFTTTHGARKGLADTALNTAKAGYLTRRLVYVADSCIVDEKDCGDKDGRTILRPTAENVHGNFANDIRGRHLLEDVKGEDGKVMFKKGSLLKKSEAEAVAETPIESLKVRSPLACKDIEGVCKTCYGLDLSRNDEVVMGETVGVVAAQAIGEPGTQLTMRTFHSGGVASGGGDIVAGLPRVEEIFDRRSPKNSAVISTVNGTVTDVKNLETEQVITVLVDPESQKKLKKSKSKSIRVIDDSIEYSVLPNRVIKVNKGDTVEQGQILTDGSADLTDLYTLAGRIPTEEYIMREVHNIYLSQGASIARKHIEIIVRQMFSRRKIADAGDTVFAQGEVVTQVRLRDENEATKANGGEIAKADETLLGISDVSLTTDSFLASASFENTQKILTNVSLRGAADDLSGIKENVIIGRLIPAGTGYPGRLPEEFVDSSEEETE